MVDFFFEFFSWDRVRIGYVFCDEKFFVVLVEIFWRHAPDEPSEVAEYFSLAGDVLSHSVKVYQGQADVAVDGGWVNEDVPDGNIR